MFISSYFAHISLYTWVAVAPEFFNMNLVMAGRAHWHLGQHQEALDLFKRASHVTPRSPDERLAYAKAHEMLKKMAPEKHHR